MGRRGPKPIAPELLRLRGGGRNRPSGVEIDSDFAPPEWLAWLESGDRDRVIAAGESADLSLIPRYDPRESAGDCRFDAYAAGRVLIFFEHALRHNDGIFADQPFTLAPWQRCLLANLFGWLRPDGTRRYREALVMVPRGNGKTPLAAGIGLYGLFMDGERGAQIYSVAADKEQAAITYRYARGMVEKDSILNGRATIYAGDMHRSIVNALDPSSVFRVLSSDAKTKHGLTPHMVIADEIHAWPKRELWDVFATAFAKRTRRQPLFLAITTADYEREGSICNERQEYAVRVRDGLIDDPSFLPVIYAADPADDWQSPDTWAKANPNLDITVERAQLQQRVEHCKHSPASLNEFLRLHLNVRTKSDNLFILPEAWNACCGMLPDSELVNAPCHGGLDLSTTTDLSAFALVWQIGQRFVVKVETWIPGKNLAARERRDHDVPYRQWEREGWLNTTPGDVIDYDFIRTRIHELAGIYTIKDIAYDPWNATQLAVQLQGDGLKMLECRQGFSSMSSPTKELNTLVLGGNLLHGGNPVLTWAIGNMSVETDAAGNVKPSKAKSRQRIDPAVAVIMALRVATLNQTRRSIYETRGMVKL